MENVAAKTSAASRPGAQSVARIVTRFDPFCAAQPASTPACCPRVKLVRTKYGDRSVTIEVPDTMITVAVLLSVTNGAIASALGVSPPPRIGDLVRGQQFLGDTLRIVGDAGVIPHDEFDLAAGDDIAMLRHVEPCSGHGQLSGRAQRSGQWDDESDLDAFLRCDFAAK